MTWLIFAPSVVTCAVKTDHGLFIQLLPISSSGVKRSEQIQSLTLLVGNSSLEISIKPVPKMCLFYERNPKLTSDQGVLEEFFPCY